MWKDEVDDVVEETLQPPDAHSDWSQKTQQSFMVLLIVVAVHFLQ